MNRDRLQRTLVVLLASALVLIGIGAVAAPELAAAGFGLPEAVTAGPGFVRATGARDIALGAVLLALVAARVPSPAIGAGVLATALVPVADATVVWMEAGLSQPAALALHAVSIPFLVGLGLSMRRPADGRDA